MRVSCISPCYNMERYLKLFLEELPKQTIFDEIEVVLDHNEPTNQELEWVASFQKQYPGKLKHIIVNPVDPIGISMNRCIAESLAPNICIWNVDDLRTPDSLEKQVKILEENSDVGVSYGNFIIVKSWGSKHGQYMDHNQFLYPPQELTRGMILGPFFMWRKSLNEVIGYFDEQLKSGADFDLAVRLCSVSKAEMVHGVLGYYLDEGRGASTNGSWKQPVERTVVEVRYGITDKVEPQLVQHEKFKDYDPMTIVNFGKAHCVREFFEDYDAFTKGNSR